MEDLSSKVETYGQFVYLRSYSRWLNDKRRRETWSETVDRYMGFFQEVAGNRIDQYEYDEIRDAIFNLHVMPSMRLLWSAGEAARINPAASFNCNALAANRLEAFSETLFLLTSGCGVGFSCELEQISKLPSVSFYNPKIKHIHVIEDSREGWADALLFGLRMWYSGQDVKFDYSGIRPLGSPLITFGGRASGPEPLHQLLEFTKKTILNAQGRKLRPIEVHDIFCLIGQTVVAGGTRRSSLISLSDLDDWEVMTAKNGDFPEYRYLSNNSAVYKEKPGYNVFHREWVNLVESGTGERGIFNREGLIQSVPERRKRFTNDSVCLTNPCAEVVFFVPNKSRGGQVCNLTNIVAGEHDGVSELMWKAKIASVLGTYQSMLTDFTYLSTDWKRICESERLLGVSIAGVYDNELLLKPHVLQMMRDHVVRTNKIYADKFGINPSTATTCIKPSGNSGSFLGTSSGAHPRYSPYYIRRVRISASDPLFKMIRDQGVPYYPEVGQNTDLAHTFVLEFPVKSPDGSVMRKDIDALTHLEHWKILKLNYAEHTVSATIYVGQNEWDAVRDWVWNNWNFVGGLSFLPKEDENVKYELAPYEEVGEMEYYERNSKLRVDFSKLSRYENEDRTEGSKEYACVGNKCELI